jgi:diacylglycerol kinase family enzyme
MDWQAVLVEPADLIVLAGGDGTIGKAVGLLAGRDTPVAMLPTGTANNLAKLFGVMGDARDVVASWRERQTRPLDVWRAETDGHGESFVEAIGGGLLAAVIVRALEPDAQSLILGSGFDRALHWLRTMSEEEPSRPWGIEIDGMDHSGEYIGVEVMNGRYVGPNIPLAPDATPGDGKLDVVMLHGSDRGSLAQRFESLATAQMPAPRSLRIVRGATVRLRPQTGVALHLDGEAWTPNLTTTGWLRIASAGVVNVVTDGGRDPA